MSNAFDFNPESPRAVRQAIRSGRFRGFTNGLASGFVQGNLMIVPAAQADDFAAYCALNPQALPVLGRSEPGSPHIPALGADLDLRTDVGGYMVFRDGELSDTPHEISELWRDDLVAFVLGCSFSFEGVLQQHGVRLRHLDEGQVSAMYVTGLPTQPSGVFGGPLVVSMRALRAADAIRAISVSAGYPQFHGAPVHLGQPGLIGIGDLAQSYGGHGLTQLHEDELPVFWACGATAQLAARQARLPLCITHYKAHMVVTDLPVHASGAISLNKKEIPS
ncbi:MAG TPA: DUF1445 domain-containing protein [Ideonella sp.]|uniref:putative hydro-lyase n=1 Tax=Ideonella sp. TaxID=1929293 RepID=UPI002C86F411|nr:DUF1445 domain-containing protein [Ideonella sp.]HSI47188.1 DUF1445 domain-containing protein [Ideonella sp.]